MSESTVAELLSRLEGLEKRPLAVQAELLEATRRGLDEVLAQPASAGAEHQGAQPRSQPRPPATGHS